jgi:hypothetical protein
LGEETSSTKYHFPALLKWNWPLLTGSVRLEEFVLRRHREIFYGLLFGFGAAAIDMFIDARTQNKSFWDVSIGMTLYRFSFVIFKFCSGVVALAKE